MTNFNPYFKFIHQKSILLKIEEDIDITKIIAKLERRKQFYIKNNGSLCNFLFVFKYISLYNNMEPSFLKNLMLF